MQTKTVTISLFDAATIKDIANSLKGEDALEDLSIMLHDPEDEQLRGIALESVLKFYANARTLTRVINDHIKIE